MSNISGMRGLLSRLNQIIEWLVYPVRAPGDSLEFIPTPIQQFADFVLDHPVVFIFVVAVPLVGLGIGLLRRLLNS